jgi:hypothetical protein
MVTFTNNPTRANTSYELITIDSIRQKIIDGDAYYAWDNSWNNQAIAKDGSWNAVFYSGGTLSHKVKVFAEIDASVNYRVFELAATPGTGTAIALRNYNRNSSNTCSGVLYKNKFSGKWAQIAAGTEIRNKAAYAVNSSGPQGHVTLGSAPEEYSFITSPTKYYVLHLYNRGPNALHLHVHMRISEGTV